jgi:signal transducing adaptor molecule
MSVRDKGGRTQWSDYSAYGSSSSSSRPGASSAAAGSSAKPTAASTSTRYSPPPASSGYVPAQQMPPREDVYTPAPGAQSYAPPMPVATPAPAAEPAPDAPIPIVTRVRALHAFEPTEAGELAFEKGDIIKVVDRGYKDWWRGQLKGRTGIFPVNYVVSSLIFCLCASLNSSPSGTSAGAHWCSARSGGAARGVCLLAGCERG